MTDIYIEEDKSILDAMCQLDRSGKKILFVHKDKKLLASLTDGDIRRWILKKGDLKMSVQCAANYQPKFLYEQEEDLAMRTIKELAIDAVPIVNNESFIQKIVFANDTVQEHKKI